MKKNIEDS